MRYLPPVPGKYKVAVLGGIALLALLGIDAVFGSRGALHLQRLHTQQEEAEAIAFQLADENRQRREHLDRLERDDSYLERHARQRLGWIRTGERLYRVHRGESEPAEEAAAPTHPGL